MIAFLRDHIQETRLRTLDFNKVIRTTYFRHGQLSLLGRLSYLRLGMLLYKLGWLYTVYIFGRRSCEVSWCSSFKYCFWLRF